MLSDHQLIWFVNCCFVFCPLLSFLPFPQFHLAPSQLFRHPLGKHNSYIRKSLKRYTQDEHTGTENCSHWLWNYIALILINIQETFFFFGTLWPFQIFRIVPHDQWCLEYNLRVYHNHFVINIVLGNINTKYHYINISCKTFC